MSLATNISDFATRVGTEFKAVRNSIGLLTGLTTADKTSIVGAINEVKASVAAGRVSIDDASTTTTSVWSSSKTSSQISSATATVKSEILGGAGAAYDTLQELRTLMTTSDSEDDAAINALNTAVGNRVRFDGPQTLTAPQAAQARANIDAASATEVGNTATNFVNAFEAALV